MQNSMSAIIVCLLLLLAVPASWASLVTARTPLSSTQSISSTTTNFSRPTTLSPTPVSSLSAPTRGPRGRNMTTTAITINAKVTPAPATGGVFFEPGSRGNAAGVEAKFRQTTYYTCVTWPSTVHCGWHEPILDASMNAAGSQYDSRSAAIWAGVVGSVVFGFVVAV